MVAYFDQSARADGERLNYTDLVIYEPGFENVDRGDLLLPVLASAPGCWLVSSPLIVNRVEIGGDSLDIYVTPSHSAAPGQVTTEELERLGFAFQLEAWPRRLPDVVARYLRIK